MLSLFAIEHIGAGDLVLSASHQRKFHLVLNVFDVNGARSIGARAKRSHNLLRERRDQFANPRRSGGSSALHRDECFHHRVRNPPSIERGKRAVSPDYLNLGRFKVRKLGSRGSARCSRGEQGCWIRASDRRRSHKLSFLPPRRHRKTAHDDLATKRPRHCPSPPLGGLRRTIPGRSSDSQVVLLAGLPGWSAQCQDRRSSLLTAAGQFRICTGFPFHSLYEKTRNGNSISRGLFKFNTYILWYSALSGYVPAKGNLSDDADPLLQFLQRMRLIAEAWRHGRLKNGA